MNRNLVFLVLSVATLGLFVGCGGGGGGSTGVEFSERKLDFSVPYDGASNVAAGTNVTIAWDGAIDCTTVTTANVTADIPGWTRVSCADNKAVFSASGQVESTVYTVTITSRVKDSLDKLLSPQSFRYTTAATPPTWSGTVQYGTSAVDDALYSAVDANGNIYVVGDTNGVLDDSGVNGGSSDAYVAKYDPSGTLDIAWTTPAQFLKTVGEDLAFGVDVDGRAVYVVGSTDGDVTVPYQLEGSKALFPQAGTTDAYLAKIDADTGSLIWIVQFGTLGVDLAYGVKADGAGNVYVAGVTLGAFSNGDATGQDDAYLVKFDANGDVVWQDELSNPRAVQYGDAILADDAFSVAIGPGGFVYTAGETSLNDSTGLGDAYVARFDPFDGEQLDLWTFGALETWDYANNLAIYPTGELYVAGKTVSSFTIDKNTDSTFPSSNAFLAKLDGSPSVPDEPTGPVWTRTLDSTDEDEAFGVMIDGAGYLYLTGRAGGALTIEDASGTLLPTDAPTNAFDTKPDGFLVQFLPDGTPNWVDYIGTAGNDVGNHVVTGVGGELYVVGRTSGALDGNSIQGSSDGFLVRYKDKGVRQ